MNTYFVKNKSDGDIIYEYTAENIIEWEAFPLSGFDHIISEPPPIINPDGSIEGQVINKEWDSFTFLRKFTIQEQASVINLSKTDSLVAAFWHLLDKAPIVHAQDSDLNMGLHYLVVKGIISDVRMQEILND